MTEDLSQPPASMAERENHFVTTQESGGTGGGSTVTGGTGTGGTTGTGTGGGGTAPACANPALVINQIDAAAPAARWGKGKAELRAHCAQLGLPVPDGSGLQGLFTYQGAYQRIAADADELVCRLARFKAIYLTHAFALLNEQSAFVPQDGAGCAPRRAAGNRFDVTDPYLILKNGRARAYDVDAALDGAYFDPYGRGLFYVISKLRHLHGDDIQIYGYVGATVDNPQGTWSNLIPAQNYLCPGGVCTDFMAYVNKWRSLERTWANAWIDGFFIDMVNEFYVHKSTYAGQAAFVRGLRSEVTGRAYKLAVNTLETGTSLFYPGGNAAAAVVSSSKRPIPWAADELRAGDSIVIEGFVYKAGHAVADLEQTAQELRALPAGVRWSAVTTETTFIPPFFVAEYDAYRESLASSLYAGLGGLTLDQAYASYEANLSRLTAVNSGSYFRGKSVTEMSRYLVDFNVLLGADQAAGGRATGDDLCRYVRAQTGGGAGTAGAVTTQELSSSCLASAQQVSCASENWQRAAYHFNTLGGENLTYHEGGLGSYSGLYAAGCFWTNPDAR